MLQCNIPVTAATRRAIPVFRHPRRCGHWLTPACRHRIRVSRLQPRQHSPWSPSVAPCIVAFVLALRPESNHPSGRDPVCVFTKHRVAPEDQCSVPGQCLATARSRTPPMATPPADMRFLFVRHRTRLRLVQVQLQLSSSNKRMLLRFQNLPRLVLRCIVLIPFGNYISPDANYPNTTRLSA